MSGRNVTTSGPRFRDGLGRRLCPAAWLLAAAVLAVPGCGGDPAAEAVSLEDLARFPHGYEGRRVAAEGTVRTHPSPEHYWIEDDALNRVEIHPGSAVSSRVGERVRVVGRFHYSRDTGRSIEAESVEPAGGSAP